MDKSFDNSLVLTEDIIKSLENMLKYQNFKLKENLKKSI
jgi:hypothetical protein